MPENEEVHSRLQHSSALLYKPLDLPREARGLCDRYHRLGMPSYEIFIVGEPYDPVSVSQNQTASNFQLR
ncbi:Methionine--tRNA ligase, cytoplasmic [Clarias magur]|uniref:Methionine--tRNA ligase, cytoplasmic n=1 Tax=Clarias magur TaxID=1594786 RepID=A0A8J4TG85_CLAMG|nr:Methionine--tRNA ligase, cytoplasmic [Clarias magur]